MRTSSHTRSKHSFVPWLAAILLGASAHAGWLIHELRDDHGEPGQVLIQLELDGQSRTVSSEAADFSVDREAQLRRARARAHAHARAQQHVHAHSRLVRERPPADLDLDLWVEQTDRYRYSIDRRALEQIAVAEFDAGLEQLGVFARALTLAEPIELRNIRQGTHLWLLGLRNGDRLRAVSTRGEPALDQVELELLRRGRPVTIVYELS